MYLTTSLFQSLNPGKGSTFVLPPDLQEWLFGGTCDWQERSLYVILQSASSVCCSICSGLLSAPTIPCTKTSRSACLWVLSHSVRESDLIIWSRCNVLSSPLLCSPILQVNDSTAINFRFKVVDLCVVLWQHWGRTHWQPLRYLLPLLKVRELGNFDSKPYDSFKGVPLWTLKNFMMRVKMSLL